MTKSSGLFITLEGGEGAGKTTLLQALALHYQHLGREVVTTREPGATDLGAKLRELLLHSKTAIASRAELFLFLADRAQHVESVIRPALSRGAVVISDRFYDSTLAYQGAARHFDAALLETMCLFATGTLRPDRTFFLDIDPALGLARATGKPDRLESEALAFHTAVRDGFLSLMKKEPKRITRLDASRPIEEVITQAVSCL